jgi:cyclophilin family peptidyl-prolyl cis-trans isomerase
MKKTLILLFTLVLATGLFAQKVAHGQHPKEKVDTVTILEKRAQALIQTEFGDIVVELYNETPRHRDNFIKLVKDGFYNGTLFHRVVPNFVIQGGDPDSKHAAAGQSLGDGGPGYTIPAEFSKGLFHKTGALGAAREPDAVNPKKASSGSQFYIVQGEVYHGDALASLEKRMKTSFSEEELKAYTTIGGKAHLDGGYTVFGEVIKGLELVEKITSRKRDKQNRPLSDISMKITLIK